ncbi:MULTISPECIES: DcaP family trimeric outer membrane transporter [Halomonadaceae]|uniref:DcaP family trimeric outer membrane transporter n=1 Tax=Halomonadaceae TaxID=28256 RepID=UPI001598E38F|nr:MULTISPECIES: DcaP family trimeric outer membrane transporter [Halomonas]QJQ95973.1 hypothetical protein HIO72_12335 [Halomonas sp. PA5]
MTCPHPLKQATLLSGGALALLVTASSSALEREVGNTTIGLEGYLKLDVIRDLDADLGNTIDRESIRVDDEGEDGHTRIHGYESRFGVSISTPLADSELETMIEADFLHGRGGGLRLRHLYGEWNGILIGQTWSNFGNNLSAFPSIDINALPSQDNDRQLQLRYTTGPFSASLEDARGTGNGQVGGDIAADGADRRRYPDLTLRYETDDGDFNYALAGVLRYLEYDSAGMDVENAAWSDDSTIGWGVTFEASKSLTERVTLRGSVTHGDGVGSYLYLNPADPGYVDDQGRLRTIRATGGGASLSVEVGPGDVSFGYGIVRADLDRAYANGDVEASDSDEYQSVFLNYIWSSRGNLSYGLEAGYHARSQVDGQDGSAARLQGMVKYDF